MKIGKRRGSFQETFGRLAAAGAVVAVTCLFGSGCAAFSGGCPDPVTVAQILDMSKAGTPTDQIISKIKASGTVYRLKASQLAELQTKGVPAVVIDYMQQTYVDAVKRDAEYENWRHWTMCDDYWYGGVPFGWPYETVYVIREHRAFERGEPPRREQHEGQEHEHGRP